MLRNRITNCLLFLTECENWKKRSVGDQATNSYYDVYDGNIWKDFDAFFQCPNNLALQLNVDWFQPFDHLTYSVGAMYITILNLSSTERYKLKNVLLVGLIPGPDEPKHDINAFLKPIVDDLLELWHRGIVVDLPVTGIATIKCALTCIACDIPAARKVSGFIGHSGCLGCSKCKKEFKSMDIGKLDYSGFDRNNWPSRSDQQHRNDVKRILSCTSKTEREKKESELGCRYSLLLDLPYFDPIRMTIIDPMHNLFLGTAKRFMAVRFDTGKLTKDDLITIQREITAISVPQSHNYRCYIYFHQEHLTQMVGNDFSTNL